MFAGKHWDVGVKSRYCCQFQSQEHSKGHELSRAAEEFRSDEEIVLAAVSTNGRALQYASEGLRADRRIVQAAIAQDGRALEHASDSLKGDREIVLAAVTQSGESLKFAKASLAQPGCPVVLSESLG
eukprot:4883863-Amphidinium_carterae.1